MPTQNKRFHDGLIIFVMGGACMVVLCTIFAFLTAPSSRSYLAMLGVEGLIGTFGSGVAAFILAAIIAIGGLAEMVKNYRPSTDDN